MVVGAAVIGCAAATAQTVYKWTDDRGVIHFADSPPPEARKVEERHLPGPPASQSGADVPAEVRTPRSDAQAPAQVIIASRMTPRTGPSSVHIQGEVRNVGGRDAARVAVTVVAADPHDGSSCVQEEIDVSPPTLRPGQTGSFETDVDNPCLLNQPSIDIAPVWD
ncbi:MAG: DUF4124 domain-containing protein [Candidatus Binatia bacterium]